MHWLRPRSRGPSSAIGLAGPASLLLALASPVLAQPIIGLSNEAQINSFTIGEQYQADIAGSPAGRSIVVWASSGSPEDSGTGRDIDGLSVHHRFLDIVQALKQLGAALRVHLKRDGVPLGPLNAAGLKIHPHLACGMSHDRLRQAMDDAVLQHDR